jgi:hypothetical protein
MLAVSFFPRVFDLQGQNVFCFSNELYEAFPYGCHLGVCGKWVTCFLFIPPLALFATNEESKQVLKIHSEASGVAL